MLLYKCERGNHEQEEKENQAKEAKGDHPYGYF